jgi:2-polyprenyl-6-methoxyphenol hydroxylase-like FAD-dependent oxidoreductase
MPAPSTQPSCDCLIVGAGPVGMTAALELNRHGLNCRIVDCAPRPTDKSKALVVWGRSLELFEKSGIASDLVASGMWAKGASIYGNGKRRVHVCIADHKANTAFPLPLMIPQNETERVLNENLNRRKITVERSVELVEFKQNQPAGDGTAESVSATVRHADGRTEQITSSWLIGCDGAHSVVRKQLGLEFTGEAEPNDWVLADVHIDGEIANDEISAYWHADGVVIFFPFAPGRFRVIADLGKAQGTGKPADPTLADAQQIVDRRGPQGLRLFDPVWLSGFRINERKVSKYETGRVLVAGDAAHIHSPAGGQGMNTGMQDAFNLAWKVALVHKGHGRATPLLESYTVERSAVGEMVLHDAGMFTRVAMLRNPVLQFMRNHLMEFAGKFSAVQEKAIAHLTEMTVHYEKSPLNADDAGNVWSDAIKPGDRLPDCDLSDVATGNTVKLLATLRGTCHWLLVMPSAEERSNAATLFEQIRATIAPFAGTIRTAMILPSEGSSELPTDCDAVLIDDAGGLRTLLGLRKSALALVRPDGYLAFRGHAESCQALEKHLAKYLIPTATPTGRAKSTPALAASR